MPPILLFHSLPASAFLGLDLLSLTTSPNLRGIKSLPPGYHFLYSSSDASLSIRRGCWFYIPAPSERSDYSKVLVWRWSTEEECLVREAGADTDAAEMTRRDPGRGLLDYGDPSGGKEGDELAGEWSELTGYIMDGLLDRVLGPGGNKNVHDGSKGAKWKISTISSAPQDVEKIPGLSASESVIEGEKDLNFLHIDLKRTWREGAVGRERTDAARDRSWYLGYLIKQAAGVEEDRRVGAAQLLGELQLCFLMVLTLANWSCLEQWKRILAVLLSCRRALVEVEDYFVAVVRLLEVQLRRCESVEGGLFDFKEEGAGWLRGLLTQFRRNVEESFDDAGGQALKAELDKVEEYLKDRYGWESGKNMLKRGLLELEDGERVEMDMNGVDEEDETGEYASVVVDLG